MSLDKDFSHPDSTAISTSIKKVVNPVLKLSFQIIVFFLYMFLVPLLLFIVSPLYLYRFVIGYISKKLHPSWGSIMSPRDAIVGLENITKTCECMLTVSLVCEGTISLEALRSEFQTNILDAKNSQDDYIYDRLRHHFQPWMGFTFWRPEKHFSLENHVKYCEETETILKSGGSNNNGTITEQTMLSLLGNLSQKTFPSETSPWELLIIRNYEPENSTSDFGIPELVPNNHKNSDNPTNKILFIFRIHHALADGYSIMNLLCTKICKVSSKSLPQPPIIKTSVLEKMVLLMKILFFTPYCHLRQFVLDVDRNEWHCRQLPLSHRLHFGVSERLPLEQLKGIARKQHVSLTVLILAIWGGAIHRFLKTSRKGFKFPKYMRALAPMPWTGHPMEGLVNHWTAGVHVIPVGSNSPRERLQQSNKFIQRMKRSPVLHANFWTVPVLLGGPNWLTNIWGRNWMSTMVMSNFPAPAHKLNVMNSCELEDCFFWLPPLRGSAGIGMTFMSYNGGARTSIAVDKAIMPNEEDVTMLARYMTEEALALDCLEPVTKPV